MTAPPGKALELLCYLLIHRDRIHTREVISELLWPDTEPGAARKYLRQTLWRLNTALQDRSDDHGEAREVVVVDPHCVRINPAAACWLDVDAFQECYATVRDTPGHALSGDQARAVEFALDLYRGDLLATWYHDWCGHERDRLRHAHLAMLDQLMGHCEAHGLYAKGVGFGQAVLRHDAAREHTHRQLMRLHYAAGDRTAALRQYERCTSVVDQEFGVLPSADTTVLYEHIRADRVEDILPGGARPVVLGRPTLKLWNGGPPGLAEPHGHLDPVPVDVIPVPRPRSPREPASVDSVPVQSIDSSGPDIRTPGGLRDPGRRPAEYILVEGREDIPDGGQDSMSGSRYTDSTQHLLAELARLDVLLGRQVRRARRSHREPADELSALYITEAEVDRLLDGTLDTPPDDGEPETEAELDRLSAGIAVRVAESVRDGVSLRLVALAGLFDLHPVDVDVVVMCLAPEMDRRYERLYGYLHDDMTRRLPTVGLALDMVSADRTERAAARTRFAPSAPLVGHRLITLTEDSAAPPHSLLGNTVRLDPRVAGFLLGDDELAGRLRPYARIVPPTGTFDDLHFPAEFGASLTRLSEHADDGLVVYCQGPYGVGKQSAASAWSLRWKAPLLVVSADLLAERPMEEFAVLVALVDREARLQGAVMYWENVDALLGEQARPRLSLLLSTLAAHPAPVFLAGDTAWEPSDPPRGMTFVRLEFPAPGYDERLSLWESALDGLGGTDRSALDLAAVSGKFRLSGGQIHDAAATARNLAHARAPGAPRLTQDDLYAACRLQSNRKLAELAQRITPHYAWDDIVLPADRMEQLREVADQVRYRALVYESWGFERKLANGRGLAVLFAGPSGTGKTMAADVLAHELGLDLYKIDLSTVVSKYIGETEKNLSRIFAEAATSNAVLFFDEADAMFGKRTQVRDAHDRHANLETSYLLQRMEQHEGVVVLATNLRKNLDDAFIRRLHVTIDFPVPGVEDRRRIWEQVWPKEAPLDGSVDPDLLARQIDLPGGNIRNIALAGAFLAAADGGVVTMGHLLRATRREYQKMGKILTAGDFGTGTTTGKDASHAFPSE
ncbi:AAA family ATPase [Streptomyces phaeochromogenes]|uniref:AAA family ATPase n=1 Tax=Streptomyces phaeochromogenes TaxID=1923 RepID=UPI002E0DE700|nr:AAA family ATPase [Streptomyces phaeochromogenes]WSJ08605.1 AAA family ATPase [Streptomyces phaeochromogenes]